MNVGVVQWRAIQEDFTWTASTSDDTEGYNVCIDTDGAPFSNCSDVGNVTSEVIENLTNDVEYFIGVSAYDGVPNESDYATASATPFGAGSFEHANYTQLVADPDCGPGATTSMGGIASGTFTGQSTDPAPATPNVNRGIGILCDNRNFWKRDGVINENNPAELDWYCDDNDNCPLGPGDDMTAILAGIAVDHAPIFAVRMPSSALGLESDHVDVTSIEGFYFYENAEDVIYVSDNFFDSLFTFGSDIEEVVFGNSTGTTPLLTVEGNYPQEDAATNECPPRRYGGPTNQGVIRIRPGSTVNMTDDWHFNINFEYTNSSGIFMGGNFQGGHTMYFQGLSKDSGLWPRVDTGPSDVNHRFDNVVIQDATGCNFARWEDPDVKLLAKMMIMEGDNLQGDIECQYGNCNMFFTSLPTVGTEEEPFEITIRDQGYSETGTEVGFDPNRSGWKPDPIRKGQQGQANPICTEPEWYIHHTDGPNDHGFNFWSFQIEVTGGNGEFFSDCVDAIVANLADNGTRTIEEGHNSGDNCDTNECHRSRRHVFHGDGVNPMTLDGAVVRAMYEDTVRDATVFGDIELIKHGTGSSDRPAPFGSVIRDLTLAGSSRITTHMGSPPPLNEAHDATIRNVTAIGSARRFIRARSGSTGWELYNVTAPTGSEIEILAQWSCDGTNVSSGVRTIQSIPGAQNNGDGTYTICD